MFGYTIIRKDTLEVYEKAYRVQSRVHSAQRWFSGWQDLDVIWDWLLKSQCDVGDARKMYALRRRTNEYGTPLPKTPRKKKK